MLHYCTDISQNQYNLHDKEYKSIKRTTSSPFINHILPQTNCFSHFGSYLDPVHYKALVSTLRIFTMVYTSLQLNKSLFLLLNTTEYHCKNSSRLHNQNTPVFIMKMLLSHQGKRNSHNFHLDTFYWPLLSSYYQFFSSFLPSFFDSILWSLSSLISLTMLPKSPL